MTSYTAFANEMWLATGSEEEVLAAARALPPLPRASDLLIFDDSDGRQVDLPRAPVARPAQPEPARTRGRPSLGVVAREVTLLPRHWEWLAAQPGGASATLRRLVDAARKADGGAAAGRDAAYRFLTVMAGDRPGYEEAIRALYAGDRARFEAESAAWPAAIRAHAIGLAWGRAGPG